MLLCLVHSSLIYFKCLPYSHINATSCVLFNDCLLFLQATMLKKQQQGEGGWIHIQIVSLCRKPKCFFLARLTKNIY